MSEQGDGSSVAPDSTLAALYKSERPLVELVPGVPLSALINAAWLPANTNAKAMLAESWIPVPPEPAEGEEPPPPPPTFNPAAAEYNEMPKRLAKSAPLLKWNELTVKIKQLELELEKEKDEKVREEKTLLLEASKAGLAEADQQMAEIKASFYEDQTSLVPWMRTLFDLADAGMTTFDVSGKFFPHTTLQQLFKGDNQQSFYQGPEAVLAAFKKRYEKERGPNKIQLLYKLVPNIFQDGYNPQTYVETMIEKIRTTVFGGPSPDALDLVQLVWWDVQEGDFIGTLKALQRLTEDKLDMNEETGDVLGVGEPRKIRGIGLVDFPSRAIVDAIQAGVPIVSLQVPFSLTNRSYQKTLETAKEYNIKVFARDGLMGGLLSEKYIGVAPPSTSTTDQDPDLDDVAQALDLVNSYGGWEKFQKLLAEVKKIADKHGVKMQTVALRWQIDQGTFPVATTRWSEQSWTQFGYYYHRGATPGVDWQLFAVDSFLDADDMKKLNALAL